MSTAASGDQHTISGGGYEAVVAEAGATLRTMSYGGRPVVAGYPDDQTASGGRGQLLLPWPNRIEDGVYTFAGDEHVLPITERGTRHASHGLVRWASWTLTEKTDDAAALSLRVLAQPGYPWVLDLGVRYSLSASGLLVEVSAQNLSDDPAPFAAGAHPYLLVADVPVDEWELDLPAATALETDDRLIPTGRLDVTGTHFDFRGGRPIGAAPLDTAFTDLDRAADGSAEVTVRHGGRSVTVWMDASHRWVQVYAGSVHEGPSRTALAVEPMTAPPNAFNSGEDLLVLASGERRRFTWGLRAT